MASMHRTTPKYTAADINPTTRAKLARCDHFFVGELLIIASASELGKLYRVGPDGCTCQAAAHGLRCWHADAQRYLTANMIFTETLGGPRTVEEIDQAEVQKQVAAMRLEGALRIGEKKTERIRQHMAARQYTETDYDELF